MVPELEPWFLDRLGPPAPRMIPGAPTRVALGAAFGGGRQVDEVAAEVAAQAAPLWDAVAVLEQGATAARTGRNGWWRCRPTVTGTAARSRYYSSRDATTCRASAGEEAHLRAKVATSPHLPGGAPPSSRQRLRLPTVSRSGRRAKSDSRWHRPDPGRARAVRRTAAKAFLSSAPQAESRITSPTTRPAHHHHRADQLPVSRDAITVKGGWSRPDRADRPRRDHLGAGWAGEQGLHLGYGSRWSRRALAGWRE
jgi:hypothetical protein